MPKHRHHTPAIGLQQNRHLPRLRRRAAFWKWTRLLIVGLLLLALAVYSSFQISPWPQAILIRHGFDKGAVEIAQRLEKHVPPGVNAILDQQYRPQDNDAYLDVFYPQMLQSLNLVLPTIV
jgi:acetyl esterase